MNLRLKKDLESNSTGVWVNEGTVGNLLEATEDSYTVGFKSVQVTVTGSREDFEPTKLQQD